MSIVNAQSKKINVKSYVRDMIPFHRHKPTTIWFLTDCPTLHIIKKDRQIVMYLFTQNRNLSRHLMRVLLFLIHLIKYYIKKAPSFYTWCIILAVQLPHDSTVWNAFLLQF